MIHVTANAKLNLSLEVTGRRADGFHEIVSVMQAIDLADELVALPSSDGSVTLECNDPALADAPDNTVLRAAELLRRAGGIVDGARVLLRKSIPVAAGLGGGSSNGAAALIALDRLWNSRLPRARLAELALEVGSDVPFFLGKSSTALADGRGERITALPAPPACWAVIVIPETPVPSPKTRVLFRMLDPSNFSDGEQTRKLGRLLESGAPPERALSRIGVINTFNGVAARAFPGIGRFRDALRRAVGESTSVSLSGAGPALYAVLPTQRQAERARSTLSREGVMSIVAGMAERPLTVIER